MCWPRSLSPYCITRSQWVTFSCPPQSPSDSLPRGAPLPQGIWVEQHAVNTHVVCNLVDDLGVQRFLICVTWWGQQRVFWADWLAVSTGTAQALLRTCITPWKWYQCDIWLLLHWFLAQIAVIKWGLIDIFMITKFYNYIQCSAVIMQSVCSNFLTTDTPKLAHSGEVWGVCCEFQVRFMFCSCHCSDVCKIAINSTL